MPTSRKAHTKCGRGLPILRCQNTRIFAENGNLWGEKIAAQVGEIGACMVRKSRGGWENGPVYQGLAWVGDEWENLAAWSSISRKALQMSIGDARVLSKQQAK